VVEGEVGTNWAGNVSYAAARLERPGTVADVQRLVRVNEKVKALGGRHSFSTIADTRGALVSLEPPHRAVQVKVGCVQKLEHRGISPVRRP